MLRWSVLALCAGAFSFPNVACNPGSFLGLQDYQRDILGGLIGALAGALLDQVLPGPPVDEQSARIIPGPPGPRGAPGPAFFSVYTSRFYGAQFGSGFTVTPVRQPVPALQADGGPIGFRLFVPSIYGLPRFGETPGGGRPPVTLRLYLRRGGNCDGGCFAFRLDARRLRDGDRAPQCFGGSGPDCADGTRWIVAAPVCGAGEGSAERFLAIDLPFGAGGLQFPEIAVGDYLAVELNLHSDDGGAYRLLGVELFDSPAAELRNASVHLRAESLPAECATRPPPPPPPPDCNGNGMPDALDIASGVSADCNGNGRPDECDIADGTSGDQNANGKPDECEPDCNENDIPDALDLALGTSRDCNTNANPDECDIASGASPDANGNGIPDECEDCNGNGVLDSVDVSSGTSKDCNRNGTPDECGIARGTSADANGNGVPDECEGTPPDCNNNGVPDAQDIAGGVSRDCNTNGTPDECDIASGRSQDANSNGIPDECEDCNGNGQPDDLDLADGTSADCNTNGRPDACDIADGTSPDANANGVPDECEDCNGNGQPDDLDLADGTSQDCNGNLAPDECDIAAGVSGDVNGNGVPDECEDCNSNGVPDGVDIASGTSADCNTNGVPDECDIAVSLSDFITGGGFIHGTPSGARANFGVAGGLRSQGLWGHLNYVDHGAALHVKGTGVTAYTALDATRRVIEGPARVNGQAGFTYRVVVADQGEPGRNDTFALTLSNGYVAAGALGGGNIQLHAQSEGGTATSRDRNGNGRPDECDPDCNANGLPDDYELDSGGAADRNDNGVVDDCEPLCPAAGFTRYRLRNHPDVSSAPPPYGLRLDELFNATSHTDKFTFNFNEPRSSMWADVSDTEIRIFGVVYGGRDTGTSYGDHNWRGLWLVEFTYNVGVGFASGDDDHVVSGAGGTNSGRIRATFGSQRQWIPLVDFGMGGYSFRFGDENHDNGHRGHAGISGWGWLNHGGRPHVNVSDWIFTAVERDACLPDCNANGVHDALDIATRVSDDDNCNGVPDECECD